MWLYYKANLIFQCFIFQTVVTIPQRKIVLEATIRRTETSALANARPWNALLILELFNEGMRFL